MTETSEGTLYSSGGFPSSDLGFDSRMLRLGGLADPNREQYTHPIEIRGIEPNELLAQYRLMLKIRKAEEKIAEQVSAGKIVCPCHLAIGQEAIACGVGSQLRKSDFSFGTHRSHSHYLALGGDLFALFSEVLGKVTGCSKGMGGSMHLYDGANGFVGSVPIVGGTISLAVGAGLASRLKGKPNSGFDVGVCFFGDGAIEEGTFHESLNFASAYRVPVLFVCENNLFSSHLHISIRQPSDSVARFAAAHGIPYEVVDGNDYGAVSSASRRLLERSRQGEGPGFLEAVTYRWRGHVGPSEDIDVGVKRKSDLGLWKRRDPIRRLVEAMIRRGDLAIEDSRLIEAEVDAEVNLAWAQSEAAPYPEKSALMGLVYREGNA